MQICADLWRNGGYGTSVSQYCQNQYNCISATRVDQKVKLNSKKPEKVFAFVFVLIATLLAIAF
jgi:hypothetical protein